jgi:hypothetical protein
MGWGWSLRDYSKVAPTFWTGETGKAIRRRGIEATLVALYLMTAPGSNMLGLFPQPVLYMAYETGLGEEGARKGLRGCIEAGFCSYDEATEMVWVHEMAAWQIADELKPSDKRCKGIQKDYERLPNCAFLGAFFDRYQAAFHLSRRRSNGVEKPEARDPSSEAPYQAPSKPGAGAGAGTGTGAGAGSPSGRRGEGASPRATRKCPEGFDVTPELREWAAGEVPGVDLVAETKKFRDHTFKTARSDWAGTWRNWMRTALEDLQQRGARGNRPPAALQSFAERATAAKADRLAEMTGGLLGTTKPGRPTGEVIDMEAPNGAPRLLA